jgi:DNA repair exonuclease SbcCD ATPase subunit
LGPYKLTGKAFSGLIGCHTIIPQVLEGERIFLPSISALMEKKSHICGNCEDANLPSVCAACANCKLNEKHKLVNSLQRNRDFLQKTLDEKLKAKSEAAEQQHWRLTHAQNIAQLKETLCLKQNQLCQVKSELEEKTNELNTRKSLLDEASAVLEMNKAEELKLHSDLICSQSSYLRTIQEKLRKAEMSKLAGAREESTLLHSIEIADTKNGEDDGSEVVELVLLPPPPSHS